MRKASTPALFLSLLLLAGCAAGAQTRAPRASGPPERIGDELAGTNWQAQSVDGTPVPDPSLMTLDFLPGDQVRGQAGCNRFTGPYATRDDKITLGILRQSRLACSEAAETAQQNQLIDKLHRAWRAELGNGLLILYDRQGHEIRFVPRPG
jgi:heat shock protein HslJ